MQVAKEDLKRLLAEEKAANADKHKRGPKTCQQGLSFLWYFADSEYRAAPRVHHIYRR